MSDIFNNSSGRTTRQVTQAPGGSSSIMFGDAPATATPVPPSTTSAPPPAAEPAPAAPADADAANSSAAAPAEPTAPVEDLEVMKMKAVAMITKINKDTPEAREALGELLKKLEVSKSIVPDNVVQADAALSRLIEALKLRGSHGIIGLGRRFRSMDDNGDKKLSFEEFEKGLNEMDCGLNISDIHRLFRAFDTDCSGHLSFDELLVGLRGELNERRKDMVRMAFKVLDKTGDGQVTMADIEGRYDASKHPDVVSGIKDPKEVLLEFMETFESQGGGVAGDGIVTFEEFCKYYGSVSASVDDDDYFELMIRNVWHISGGEGWCENTTCKRVLIVQEDGTQKVVELTDDFDVDVTNMETVKAKLREQGIPFKSVALYGMDISSLGPSTELPPAGMSPGASTSTPGGTTRGDNRRANMRSSIMFG